MIDWVNSEKFAADERKLLDTWDEHVRSVSKPSDADFRSRLLDAWNKSEEESLRALEAREDEISAQIEAEVELSECEAKTMITQHRSHPANPDICRVSHGSGEHRDVERPAERYGQGRNERHRSNISFASPSYPRLGRLVSAAIAVVIAGGFFLFIRPSRSPDVANVQVTPVRRVARAEQVQLIPQRDLAVARGTRVDSATSTPTGRPELPIPRTSSDTESQRDLASTYVKLGEVAMNAGKLDEAQGWFARAITVRQSLAVDHPGDVELQRDLAITYTKQGEVAMVGRRLDDARVWFIKALTVHEAIATEQHTTPLVADSGTKWGSPWALKNNDALSEDAVAAVTRVQPSNPEQYDLAVSYKKLGDVELSAGNFDAARDWYKEASDIAEKVANPGDIWWQRERVVLCKQLGVVEVNAGDLGAAHDWYAQAYTIVEQVGAANPSDIWWRRELVVLSRQLDDVAVGAAPDGPEISGEIEGRFDGFQK